MKETVLYFSPKKTPQTAALKGLLIRMGIRIRNIAPEQVQEQVGALAGACRIREVRCCVHCRPGSSGKASGGDACPV